MPSRRFGEVRPITKAGEPSFHSPVADKEDVAPGVKSLVLWRFGNEILETPNGNNVIALQMSASMNIDEEKNSA